VLLTSGGSISYAESWGGTFEGERLGPIVGGPTAGTNGNINQLWLPGGYLVVFTGMRVRKQDGSRHHGVGIIPTVPVAQTLAGFRAGRDDVLQRGAALAAGDV
jgi:C-terminal processing protease CtpA/Prc